MSQKNSIRVLVLATDTLGGRGGIAEYNRHLVDALLKAEVGYGVELEHHSLDQTDKAKREESFSNKCIVEVRSKNKISYIKNIFRNALSKYDIIFCTHINLLPIVVVFSLFKKTKIVLGIYGVDAWDSRGFFTKLSTNFVKFCYSISEITAQRFSRWAKVNGDIFIIPNAIDTSLYAGNESQAFESLIGLKFSNKRILLTVGRLDSSERYKGIDQVLEVLTDVINEYPDVRYVIVGDGDDAIRLKNKSSSLGLDRYVEFLGYVDDHTKIRLYSSASAFVMPGSGEGFGFVYLEAIASCLPVIASKFDGSREAVKSSKTGITVNPCSNESILAGILDILNKKKEYNNLSYFSIDRFNDRVENMLYEIVRS